MMVDGSPALVLQPAAKLKETIDPDLSSDPAPSSYMRERPLGCYRIVEEIHPWSSYFPTTSMAAEAVVAKWQDLMRNWNFINRFMQDCLAIAGPELLFGFVALKMLLSMSAAISLYLTGHLMSSLERVVSDDARSRNALYGTIISFILWKLFRHQAQHFYDQRIRAIVRRRVTVHFDDHLVKARLRLDVPTYNDPEVKARFVRLTTWSRLEPFTILDNSMRTLARSASLLAEIVVLFQFLRKENNGLAFATLAAIRPVVDLASEFSDVSGPYYVYLANEALARIQLVGWLVGEKYHKHVVTDGLQGLAVEELEKNRELLKDANTEDPWRLKWDSKPPTLLSYLSSISSDLPLVLYTLYTLHYRPGQPLPFKLLTVLSSSASSLSDGIETLLREIQEMAGFHTTLRELYEISEIPNTVVDGTQEYPLKSTQGGMKIEFKSVSFSYPGSSTQTLRDMSFVVNPGQLCVIVGENGCGKSSTVNLINRVFDPTDGEILVDDKPIKEFKLDDLRRSQVMLHQDYARYPTTLSDNIGFGDVEHASNSERIRQAADAAGASEWISNLPKGLASQVEGKQPTMTQFTAGSPMALHMKKHFEVQKVEASGGQWQRMAIARTFMRTIADDDEGGPGRVKLMCYDEPSSALDPKAEFALFEKLRNERHGRTLIFITHRFGHLTKYADTILYIKNGRIEEQGTHEELLKLDGNYAQLYNVQAQAFSH